MQLEKAKRGQITKGYEADFTILDRNMFEIEAEEIKSTSDNDRNRWPSCL